MKKFITVVGLCCFLFLSHSAQAQEANAAVGTSLSQVSDSLSAKMTAQQEEISVISFKRLHNDLTARVRAPKRDQNGDWCALIKVVTKDKALFFEPDALGITARDDQPGEIWLYVPHGAKRITIKHERFGIIRNYFYDEPIDKAVTYELQLYVPLQKVERIVVKQEVTEQSLMLNYSPATAEVYIDNVLQQTNDNGAYTVVLPLGKHNYRVVAKHHKDEKGSFDIVPERLTALNVALRSEFGFVKATSNKKDTRIWINDEFVGMAPYASDTLKVGTYKVRAERKWYVPQERELKVLPSEQSDVDFILSRQKPNVFLIPQYGMAVGDNNQSSFGLMAGICRKGGAYIAIRTDGNPFDDGSSGNTLGLYTGKTKKSHISLSAGFMARVLSPLYLYAGAGYLDRKLFWETNEGEYSMVVKNNCIMAEVGLMARYKHIAVSLGYSKGFSVDGVDNGNRLKGNESYGELILGVGYVFGR